MAAATRDRKWDLLGYDSDPVPATKEGLDDIITHYKDIAAAMTEQSSLLKRIGNGDVRLLKGQAADAMRKRARESAEALGKVADRYHDVKDALVGYQDPLGTARKETGEAIDAAEDADKALGIAEDMPDPVNEDRSKDDPPLTDEDRDASSERSTAISTAESSLEAAKTKASKALEALQQAADTAAAKIKENWDVDGLHHSWQEALRHQIAKVLKKIVEILGYIGMALAVLSILIPGLGIVTLLGVVTAGLALVASITLAAMGEGSWLSVIIGIVGFMFIGVAALSTRLLKGLQSSKLIIGGNGARNQLANLTRELKNLRSTLPNFSRPGARVSPTTRWRINNLTNRISTLRVNIDRWDDFALNTTVKPKWWKPFSMNYWRVEKSRFTDVFTGKWNSQRVLGTNDIADLAKIDAQLANLFRLGPTVVPTWTKLGPWAFNFGWITSLWGLAVTPTNFSPTDLRSQFDWWKDADYSGLYSENNVMDSY